MTADNGHGNHTAAIAAGNGKTPAGNGLRVEGIAPNASLMLMKVTGAPERDQFAKSYAKAITDAVNLGATVISMSFGKTADSLSTVHEDVKRLWPMLRKRVFCWLLELVMRVQLVWELESL